MQSIRKVKIVCTLGPSSRSVDQIVSLIEAGMDIARLNFSHGDHEFHKELIANVRAASKKTKKPIAIMQDLQGPKIRVGKVGDQGIHLKEGQKVLLYPEGSKPKSKISADTLVIPMSKDIAESASQDARVGAKILFDDGKLCSKILKISSPEILIEIEVGGHLTNNKGMNFPGTPLSIPCLTAKDLEDLKFGIAQEVDAVALSFVRDASDIEDLRKRIKKLTDKTPLIVAKIEREEAIEVMDSIVAATDVLLVARGDMAVEIGAERVPTVQKKLIHTCNELGVPVITATQMLESMISSPTPTRAEASDVANAVFDGTDCVMLSGESANGKYPSVAVETMARIIFESERTTEYSNSPHKTLIPMPGSVVESVEFSAARIAHHVGAAALVTLTHSGVAARTAARYRPETPLIALTPFDEVIRKLSFVWGVRCIKLLKTLATDDVFNEVEKIIVKEGWAQAEDMVVVTAGIPTMRRGTTNTVKVHRISASNKK